MVTHKTLENCSENANDVVHFIASLSLAVLVCGLCSLAETNAPAAST